MLIVKMRRNIRYYYESSYMFICGFKKMLKIKTTLEEYKNIIQMIGEIQKGIVEDYLSEIYPRYRTLIELLLKERILYKIQEKDFTRHKSGIYLPWLEEACMDTSAALKTIGEIIIRIPEVFYGSAYLKELLNNNGIQHGTQQEEYFSIVVQGKVVANYYLGMKNGNIYVSPYLMLETQLVSNQDISERLLAGFIFYCGIMSAVTEDRPVFKINELLEVDKKLYFEQIEQTDKVINVKKQSDAIKSYNALEKFIKVHDSKIKSLNSNEDYDNYIQSPLQVITIQIEDENYYFADISYERLAKYIIEIGFLEILKKCYDKDFLLQQGNETVHTTLTEKKKVNALMKLSLDKVVEGELIENLLLQEDILADFYVQSTYSDRMCVYIRELKSENTYMYTALVRSFDHVATILLTWISMKINRIDIKESFFKVCELPNCEEENTQMFETKERKVQGCPTNLGKILEQYNFGYQLLEVDNVERG